MTNRYSDNVAGEFYVNTDCISCELCHQTAPDVFRMSDDLDHHVVFHQPATAEETALALEALDGCPVEAIAREES